MQIYSCVAILIFVSFVSCRHRRVGGSAENATEAVVNASTCPDHEARLSRTDGSSLLDLGGLTVDMVKALANDRDSREVNIKDLTQLVTALAESAVLVDHPKVYLTGF